MLNFATYKDGREPLTDNARLVLVEDLSERQGFNGFRLVDRLAEMRLHQYWTFEENESGKYVKDQLSYNAAQQILGEQLWCELYPSDPCKTLSESIALTATYCYTGRTNGNRTGYVSGEGDLVESFEYTDDALTWICRHLPVLTILHMLDTPEWKEAKPTVVQVRDFAANVLKRRDSRAEREEWVAEWWRFQIRHYGREFERGVEETVKAKTGGESKATAEALAP